MDHVFYTDPFAEGEEHSESKQEIENGEVESSEAVATIAEEETNEENPVK